MNRIAIAFSTCDRPLLTRQSVEPLLQSSKFDTYWIDGSKSREAQELQRSYDGQFYAAHTGVRGGSGAAIVYALTQMLKPVQFQEPLRQHFYDYIGLVENDVLLPHDWFDKTFALFEQGKQDGLDVGAVSTRAYEDRILIQRDGYAVMHNLGAGHIILTREAARRILDTYRTQWTTENRLIFSQLAGVDIASYWAFRGSEHWLCADWRWDAVLASCGLASLALTPSPVEMIGQVPPLAEQGLTLAKSGAPSSVSDDWFKIYQDRLASIRQGFWYPSSNPFFFRDTNGFEVTFPHQIVQRGGTYIGDWKFKDVIGFGPFAWTGAANATLNVPVLGPCELMVGAKEGGQVQVTDEQSGYDVRPTMGPEANAGVLTINVPGTAAYRNIKLTALTAGVTFYGLRTKEVQPVLPNVRFDHSTLPPV